MSAAVDMDLTRVRDAITVQVRCTLDRPRVLSLFGPSGSGKTTVLRMLAGLERAARGRVEVAGQCWQDTARGFFLPPHRRPVGLVFQEPRLFGHLDVTGNLRFGTRFRGGGAAREREICELLDLEPLRERPVDGLSGGEARRVAIGRCLMTAPRLLLLDEPLSGLDEPRRLEIEPYLKRLQRELDLAVIHVSHDWGEVLRLADRVLRIEQGRVVDDGTPAALNLTRRQARAVNLFEAVVVRHHGEDQLVELELAGHALWVAGPPLSPGRRVRLLVGEEDVALSRTPPVGTSILNSLPGTLESIDEIAPGQCRVTLSVGSLRLMARVTSRSVRRLDLAPGQHAHALIKSASLERVAGA